MDGRKALHRYYWVSSAALTGFWKPNGGAKSQVYQAGEESEGELRHTSVMLGNIEQAVHAHGVT